MQLNPYLLFNGQYEAAFKFYEKCLGGSEKGKIQMPIQKTFWAVRFGMLVDQFGIPWMINCEQVA
jgi:uncharacterized glyoxalase superfamily protein PhnB